MKCRGKDGMRRGMVEIEVPLIWIGVLRSGMA
jgi:hypothetical protein